jgi:BON domain
MKRNLIKRLSIPAAILGTAILAAPAFAQMGTPHSTSNTTNPNAQNATNPDAQVPPQAPGTAVGTNQPAVPASDNSSTANDTGNNKVTNAIKDTDITAKVKYALHENDETSGKDIHVTTSNGIVTLTGEVNGRQEARAATRVTKHTEGVREVINNLHIARHISG